MDIDKLTVLTGPSNKGKSSLFRALLGLLRNEMDASFIRDPKDEAMELTLEIDGMTIKATRNKRGKVSYVLNGDEEHPYTSLDGAIPPPMKALACGEITVGEFTFDPIFGRQNSPQFLLDKKAYKPGDMNAILGAFGGTERLEAGKKEAGSRISEKNSEAKTVASEIRQAEERRLALDPMALQGSGLVVNLNALEKDARGFEAETAWAGEAATRLTRALRLRLLLDQLTMPDIVSAEKLALKASYAQQGVDSYLYVKFLKKFLNAINALDWAPVAEKVTLLSAVEKVQNLRATRRTPPDISQIDGTYSEAIGLYLRIKRVGEIIALRESIQQKQAELTEIDRNLTEAQEELRKGSCPKCGKPLEHVC